jgi:hypothetical protein
MGHVSRPLIGLLVATVAFFALWVVALKPSSSSSGGGQPAGTYQSAITKAHQAVATSDAASASAGRTVATTAAGATAQTPPAPAAKKVSATGARLNIVSQALRAHKVLALLFYNPAATDDRAVKQELKTVPTRGRRVVKLAAPVSELARYAVVSNQVPVSFSPTLVLIDRSGRASTIVGFADRFEIAQRVTDALATLP